MSADADDLAHALGRLGEHGVAGEMADAVVDRLEVVEVEDDQREAPVVALGAGDLARERLVEVAAVVQPGQRVEVGELARLAEAARVLDRRAGALRRAPRARVIVALVEACRCVRGEDARKPSGSDLAAERHGQAGVDRASSAPPRCRVAGTTIAIDARLAPVRRAGDRLALRLLVGEARASRRPACPSGAGR